MCFSNGAVYTWREPKIIRVNDEPSHAKSLAGSVLEKTRIPEKANSLRTSKKDPLVLRTSLRSFDRAGRK
jgi:hypothetical protein